MAKLTPQQRLSQLAQSPAAKEELRNFFLEMREATHEAFLDDNKLDQTDQEDLDQMFEKAKAFVDRGYSSDNNQMSVVNRYRLLSSVFNTIYVDVYKPLKDKGSVLYLNDESPFLKGIETLFNKIVTNENEKSGRNKMYSGWISSLELRRSELSGYTVFDYYANEPHPAYPELPEGYQIPLGASKKWASVMDAGFFLCSDWETLGLDAECSSGLGHDRTAFFKTMPEVTPPEDEEIKEEEVEDVEKSRIEEELDDKLERLKRLKDEINQRISERNSGWQSSYFKDVVSEVWEGERGAGNFDYPVYIETTLPDGEKGKALLTSSSSVGDGVETVMMPASEGAGTNGGIREIDGRNEHGVKSKGDSVGYINGMHYRLTEKIFNKSNRGGFDWYFALLIAIFKTKGGVGSRAASEHENREIIFSGRQFHLLDAALVLEEVPYAVEEHFIGRDPSREAKDALTSGMEGMPEEVVNTIVNWLHTRNPSVLATDLFNNPDIIIDDFIKAHPDFALFRALIPDGIFNDILSYLSGYAAQFLNDIVRSALNGMSQQWGCTLSEEALGASEEKRDGGVVDADEAPSQNVGNKLEEISQSDLKILIGHLKRYNSECEELVDFEVEPDSSCHFSGHPFSCD